MCPRVTKGQLQPPFRPPHHVPLLSAVKLPGLLAVTLLALLLPFTHGGYWWQGNSNTALSAASHERVSPVRLDWEGITCKLQVKTEEGSKNLLSQVFFPFRISDKSISFQDDVVSVIKKRESWSRTSYGRHLHLVVSKKPSPSVHAHASNRPGSLNCIISHTGYGPRRTWPTSCDFGA